MVLNYIYWNINPEIINVFGVSIRYYGLLFATGLVLSGWVLNRIFTLENLSGEYFNKLLIYGIIGIIAGARLGHCLFYEPSYFLSHPLEIILPVRFLPDGGFKFTGYQGLASHGGALGLLVALIICSQRSKQSLIRTIDLIAIVAPLGSCFIRLANLMNSEIIGMPTQVPWAFIFARVDNLPRHPAQLYEAMAYLAIFIIMLLLYKTKREKLKNGFFFGFSLTMIFFARFMIEFLKERQVSFEENMPLDMGQILSIPFIIAGVVFIITGILKSRRISF